MSTQAVTQTQAMNSMYNNPYAFMLNNTSMSNDFFGSQINWTQGLGSQQTPAIQQTGYQQAVAQLEQPLLQFQPQQGQQLFQTQQQAQVLNSNPKTYAQKLLNELYLTQLQLQKQEAIIAQLQGAEQYRQAQTTTVPQQAQFNQTTQTQLPAQSFSSSTATAPSMQDYMMADQVAKMFSNNVPLMNPYNSFFQKDVFASQMVPPQYRMNYAA